jgi:hypothetical protein
LSNFIAKTDRMKGDFSQPSVSLWSPGTMRDF